MMNTRLLLPSALIMLAWLIGLGGCSSTKASRAGSENVRFYGPMPLEQVTRLNDREKFRYFTDNAYLAAVETDREDARKRRAAAEIVLEHLTKTLDERSYVDFWTGTDTEFFGRVNSSFPGDDYSRPQVPTYLGHTRTAYVLAPGHLNRLAGVSEARARAMTGLIRLAETGDAVSCLSFQKGYKGYADPLAGPPEATWLDVKAKPVLKSVWEGSAEGVWGGSIVLIPIPRTVVLGCRRLSHIPQAMNPGVAEDAERYFAKVNVILPGFDREAYGARKQAWRARLVEQAEGATSKIRSANMKLMNVAAIYQIFPPEVDFEYERALRDGTFMDLVGSGVLNEDIAFEAEQRIHERDLLLNGTPVTPEETPLTLIYLVSKRVGN